MSINIMQWRAGIGNFYRHAYPLIKLNKNLFSFNLDLRLILINFFYSFFSENLLLLHGGIEANPGPNKRYKSFTCCNWNFNSLTAHNMLTLTSIAAYNSVHKYDFICISETYLDSSVQSDDRNISVNGYNLIRADHPSNNKRDGVCIYYRESFAVQLVKTNYLNECRLCEVSFNNKKGYIAVLYRSPSQNRLDFDTFNSNLKRFLVILTLLTLIFQLFLAILMPGQIRGGLVILKHLKSHKLILSQPLMALDK